MLSILSFALGNFENLQDPDTWDRVKKFIVSALTDPDTGLAARAYSGQRDLSQRYLNLLNGEDPATIEAGIEELHFTKIDWGDVHAPEIQLACDVGSAACDVAESIAQAALHRSQGLAEEKPRKRAFLLEEAYGEFRLAIVRLVEARALLAESGLATELLASLTDQRA